MRWLSKVTGYACQARSERLGTIEELPKVGDELIYTDTFGNVIRTGKTVADIDEWEYDPITYAKEIFTSDGEHYNSGYLD